LISNVGTTGIFFEAIGESGFHPAYEIIGRDDVTDTPPRLASLMARSPLGRVQPAAACNSQPAGRGVEGRQTPKT